MGYSKTTSKSPRERLHSISMPARARRPLDNWLSFIGARIMQGVNGGLAVTGVAAASTSVVVAASGPVGLGIATYAMIRNLMYANELGVSLARRNAFKRGFASTLVSLAKGRNWFYQGGLYRDYQIMGKNAAIRMLRGLTAEARDQYLQRYADRIGFQLAIRDLGGYETR